ncbi:MAG TPA: hypothetical protein VL069_16450 [Opitutus sp.]|nr:hypothetical protein [Opitutus sp.]
MNWVQEHLQLLIAAAAAIAYFLNSRRTAREENDETKRPTEQASPEHAERTRRVQEEIRRKIAERRTGQTGNRTGTTERVPPMARPAHVPPIDPFGGPMRRVVRKLEEAASRFDEPIRDREAEARAEEIARQAKLAEKLRELEQARAVQERRAAEILRGKKLRQAAVNPKPVVGGELHQRLRDSREVRRAIVLREILGPPVGLR